MKFNLCVVGAFFFASTQFLSIAAEPVLDGTDINEELMEREAKINRLTTEEQLVLRAAQLKAAEDPAVKAALEKRNQAIEEFRKTMHGALLKADPKVEKILERISVGNNPGF